MLNQVLDPANASAFYSFDGTAGQRLFYDARQATNTDGSVRFIGPRGNLIWSPAIGSDMDVFTLPDTGKYTIIFENRYYYPTGTTTFGFNLQPIADTTTPMTIGTRVNGNISVPGESDNYTFTLGAKSLLAFDSLVDIDIRWTLTGPNGVVVSDRSLRSSDAFDGFAILALDAGNYTLTLSAPGDVTGAYAFRLLDTGAGAALAPGVAVNGVLSGGNETDIYRFDAIAGERYFFDQVSATNTDTAWRLLDPYGGQVWGAGFNDIDVQTLKFTGTYTLLIEGRRYYSTDSSYVINVQPVADDELTLIPGDSQGIGAQVVPGPISGNALILNGRSSVEVPGTPALDLRSVVTVEAWIQVDGFANTWMPIIYKGGGASVAQLQPLDAFQRRRLVGGQ